MKNGEVERGVGGEFRQPEREAEEEIGARSIVPRGEKSFKTRTAPKLADAPAVRKTKRGRFHRPRDWLTLFLMDWQQPESALLIVGHGSTVNPDSSAPSLAQAMAIRERGLFREVVCCFWKEEPSLRDALLLFDEKEIREVYVVPNFMSEGYFTQTVIPRELELDDRLTTRPGGQVWKYCEPVGNHPAVTELLLRRAHEIAPQLPEAETSLLIVGHGTALNDNSAVAAKRQVEKIAALGRYATVLNAYMEEPPLISDWARLTNTPHVVVVPFFISDGLHSYQDIPVLLGIEPEPTAAASERAIFRRNPHRLQGRDLYYASAIGTAPEFARIILEQAAAFNTPALDLSPIP
jgi:sirohydrochlorin cobaltochelatase